MIRFGAQTEWPGTLTHDLVRRQSQFTASWQQTMDLLEHEVSVLADHVAITIEVACRPQDIRNDGFLRANNIIRHPGVIVWFETKGGPLRFHTDEYKGSGSYGKLVGWRANIRAVALGLGALRAVNRYGISHAQEQYRGWVALPSSTMNQFEAETLLSETAGRGPVNRPLTPEEVRTFYRDAARRTHPDQGGDQDLFRRVTRARDMLLLGAG